MTSSAHSEIRLCYCVLCFSVIEKYTTTTRFCLICNYVNKIIPALQSRCTKFRFAPLESKLIKHRLMEVVEREGFVLHTLHIHIQSHTHTYIHMHTYTYTCTYTYTLHMHIHYTFTHAHTCAYTYIRILIHIHTYTYCTYTYTCTYTVMF